MKTITINFIIALFTLIAFSCKQESKDNKKEQAENDTTKEKQQQAEKSSEKLELETPRPSPLGKVYQKVGLTEMEITYSRPGVKGRKIFGGLVPYDEKWRTGANASTKIELSTDVTIEGNKVPAGKYSIFTIPRKDQWTIILNKDTTASKEELKKAMDVTRFKVKSSNYPSKVETFTINFTDIRHNKANIQLLWENTSVKFKVEVPTDRLVEKQIKEKLPKASDDNAMIYYRAAEYYHMAGKDLNQALKWVNKSLDIKEEYWMMHRKANILAELGKYEKAIEAAKKSKKMAQKEGSDHYVKINEDAIKEWKKNM